MAGSLLDQGALLLTDEERVELESKGQVLRRDGGHTFISEGETTDFVLLIRKGHVKVVVGRPARIVAVRGPGDIVGEMAPIRRKPRSASVIALGEVEVLHVPGPVWVEFLYANPRAMHAQLAAADERVDQATRKVAESELAAEQRLAKALLELMDLGLANESTDGPTFVFSQSDLASLTGASLDSVKKIVRAFREQKIIDTGRRMLLVRDLPYLRAIASGDRTASL
ncbi:CRP-like cAMP-binding protein [Actinokineospora baliensis]|uniref:Crp/Fnr family transcriptional regulator n=1 Tax=Actinokineospora baliensis TaxID=547056 RepID=UPI00195D381B|nr:Crp/Fnr family transcriptional regulator [Actinokineospora baliensis]MBM7771360.1 CRP-like cAMP-binding protein [Actinokineospora baliensis]